MTAAVAWFVPSRKRPIAYCTRASSDLIALLAGDGLTFAEAVAAIRWDEEARAVCEVYVARGLGETRMADAGVR